MAGWDDVRLAGGCQCGRVRYELRSAPDHVSVLDDPEAARPVLQYSFEHTLSWFPTITTVPGRRTEEFITPDLAARFVGYQHPDHDT